MNRLFYIVALTVAILSVAEGHAQTDKSLFRLSDSLQVTEVVSDTSDLSAFLGHGGPAVENSHMALAIRFDDSGAVDLYSKSGRGMELGKYGWYPDMAQQENYDAGCDRYDVGTTLGLGGIALWDGKDVIRLVASKGRAAFAGDTKKGAYVEIISYGVSYAGSLVDISVRIDVFSKSRVATVTARELSGRKVMFATGIRTHEGHYERYDEGYMCSWGVHPAPEEVAEFPVGTGMFYPKGTFGKVVKRDGMLMIVSRPCTDVRTEIIAVSSKEAELNNVKRFSAYMQE